MGKKRARRVTGPAVGRGRKGKAPAPAANEAPDLSAIERAVVAAVDLVDRDEADALIGEGDETAALLHEAVQGEFQLLYGVLVRRHGLGDSTAARMAAAKAQLVMTQMIHNAYAAGIQRERERGGKRGR